MKVAVVTGGGGGLGRLIASGLAGRGYTVLVTDIDEDAAMRTAAELGGESRAAKHDVASPEDHRRIAALAADLGPVTLWVNNAGVLRAGYVWEQSDDELRMHAEINFLGLMFGCREAVTLMKGGGGHILNIASMSSFLPTPGIAAYGASKHAVLAFSVSLQGELEEAGIPIRVSALCPDVFDTNMVRNVEDVEQASILFARKPLSAEAVADEAMRVVDKPCLVRAFPGSWGTLARVTQPLPSAALFVLKQMRKRAPKKR